MKDLKKLNQKLKRGGKTKHNNEDIGSMTISLKDKRCICCKSKMLRISATDKHVSTLKDRKRYYAEIYACQNKECSLFGNRITPTEFKNLSFPKSGYGLDLIAEMGLMRFKENKSIPEIYRSIRGQYKHIELSEKHTENLIKRFMICLDLSKLDSKVLIQKLNDLNIKSLILSLDGIEPEKGNDILYIVREVQSGEILLAIYLEFHDEQVIIDKIIKPIKKFIDKMNKGIIGWIVDKQLALTNAIESVFPNVPIQHCQSHFLKEIRKPIREKDSEISNAIKKTPN